MFPSSSNTPPSSDLWWDLENADELETTSSLQQKIEELMAENQDLKVIAETEKATVGEMFTTHVVLTCAWGKIVLCCY